MENIKETWAIQSDSDAEWIIAQTNEELKETSRFKNSIIEQINKLKEKLAKVEEEENFKLERRDGYLIDYFERIDDSQKVKQKTQEKYRLPSGEIIKKYPAPAFKRDEKVLLNWMKESGNQNFIEIKEIPQWGELKKITEIKDGIVVTTDGEIVKGVTLEEKPPKIEFKEV